MKIRQDQAWTSLNDQMNALSAYDGDIGRAGMAGSKLGYYTEDTGQSVHHYHMGDEPPLEQYRFNGSRWVKLDEATP